MTPNNFDAIMDEKVDINNPILLGKASVALYNFPNVRC
jgi:hypothetical protein